MRSIRIADSALSVFVVFLVFFLSTLTSNFTGPHDSMAYLNMLKADHGLWHPHHLLYHVTSKYWLGLWKLVFPRVDDYFIIESYSSVWGAALLGLVFIFFRRRFNLPVVTAWLGTAIIGFSYGIWFYSVNVEVYMPSTFFALWSLYIMGRKEWSSRHVWRVSVVHSLAILFHQMNILLVPAVLYKMYTQRKNIYVGKSVFWYAATGVVLVGGMYFIAGWVIEGHNNVDAWVHWFRGYTETNTYWRPLSYKTPVLAALGFLRSIVGGQFIFQVQNMETSLGGFLKSHALQDEVFLVRGLSHNMVWVLMILSALLGVMILLLLIKFVMQFKQRMHQWGHVIVPLLLYVVIYSAYFFFWMPEILEFWLGQCIILWLLLIGTYVPAARRLNRIAALIMLLLLVINYTSSLRPMQNINNDIGYARIEKIKSAGTEKDLVVIENPWLLKEFLEYYAEPKVAIADDPALANKMDAALAAGGKVYVYPDDDHPSNFLPLLQHVYGNRMKIFQKELATIYVIE